MSNFRQLDEGMFASPQITVDDLVAAQELGVRLVINNRPEGEAPDQPPGAEVEAAARALGMDYLAIPITHSGIGEDQVDAMIDALEHASQPVLGYCRSGTRTTLLWALSEAKSGRAPDDIAAKAAAAGYDVGPIWPALEMYASQSGG